MCWFYWSICHFQRQDHSPAYLEGSSGEESHEVLSEPKRYNNDNLFLQLQVSVNNVDHYVHIYFFFVTELYLHMRINTCSFYSILMVFDLPNSRLKILDSMRKEQKQYQNMIDIIQRYVISVSLYIYIYTS